MKTAVKVGIRELRRQLKHFIELGVPLVVMKGDRKVAVLLPTGLDRWADQTAQRAALARIKKMMREQVEPAVLDWHW